MKIRIELDVFSGRPNPAWIPERGEAETIDTLLQNLPPCKTPVPTDGLGYRGFILYKEADGKNDTIHVFAGMVWLDGHEEKILADQNHIEQMLLQIARKKGYRGLLEELGIE